MRWKLLILTLLIAAMTAAGQTQHCDTVELAQTGRVELNVPGGGERYGSMRASYRTTGSPTGVSITIEGGNELAADQTPFEAIPAMTSTTGATGTAAGGWRRWFANVATLSGGTAPKIILRYCLHVSAFSIARFATAPTFSSMEQGQPLTVDAAGVLKSSPAVRYADQFAGADAAAKINACIADLPAAGGTCDARGLEGAQTIASDPFSGVTKPGVLLLGASTFTFSVTINIPSNWAIIGSGSGKTVLKPAAATNIRIQNKNAGTATPDNNIVLRDFEVDGSAPISGIPIAFRGVVGLWIQNIYAHDCWAACISLDNNTGFSAGRTAFITHNRIETTRDGTQFPIQVGPNWSQVVISKNYVRGAAAASIGVDGASFVTIEGNLVETSGAGIDVEATGGPLNNITVANNIIRNLTASAQNAIKVACTNQNVRDVEVVNNIIDTVERGILVQDLGTGTVRGVRILGNIVHDLQLAGISVNDATEVQVSDNFVYNGGKNVGAGAVDRSGIAFTNVTDALVMNNRATDFQGTKTQTHGLFLTGTTGQLWLSGSDLRGNLTGEIFDDSSGGNIAKMTRSGGAISILGLTKTGTDTFAKAALGNGEIALDNGATDTPGIHFYTAANDNIGIDVAAGQLRVIRKLDETGGTILFKVDGTTGNVIFTSDTAFELALDHAITAARTQTFPDASTTLAGLAVTQTFTAPQTFQGTLDSTVVNIISPAINDDPNYQVEQGRAATTNATVTTALTIPITASNTFLIEARVVARRTGGTGGTAEDGAAYVIRGTYKTVAGTVTLIGAVTADYTAESVAAWDATLVISGTNVIAQVTGAADTNITWHCTAKVQNVGT